MIAVAIARPNKTVKEVAEKLDKRFFGVVFQDRNGDHSFHMRRDEWPYAEGEPVLTAYGDTPLAVQNEIRREARAKEITAIKNLRLDG